MIGITHLIYVKVFHNIYNFILFPLDTNFMFYTKKLWRGGWGGSTGTLREITESLI